MLKKSLLLALISMISFQLLMAQTENENLKKYWNYRNRLHKYFVKIGAGNSTSGGGYGMCASNRVYNPSGNSSLAGEAPNAYAMRWGDAAAAHGDYLAVLATEYKLRKDQGLDLQPVLNELYYAINAINRIDKEAENYLSQGNALPDLNGFFMRDDVPGNFYTEWQNQYSATQDPRDNVIAIDSDAHNIEWGASNTFNPTNEMSQDQVIGLMLGFALVKKFVDNTFVKPRPTDQGFFIVTEIESITARIMNRITTSYTWTTNEVCWTTSGSSLLTTHSSNWVAINPVSGLPVHGGSVHDQFKAFAYPLSEAADYITGSNAFSPGPVFYGRATQNVLCPDLYYNAHSLLVTTWDTMRSVLVTTANSVPGTLNCSWPFENVCPAISNQINSISDQVLRDYNVNMCLSLASISNTWDHQSIQIIANANKMPIFDLVYAVLNDVQPLNSAAYYAGILNTAPCEGPYAYSATNYHPYWFENSIWSHPTFKGSSAFNFGDFNGNDYMWLYNLYQIAFKNTVALPDYEDNSCQCESASIISLSTSNGQLATGVSVTRKFPDYLDLEIKIKEYLIDNLDIVPGGSLSVFTDLVVCNNSQLRASSSDGITVGDGTIESTITVRSGSRIKLNTGTKLIIKNKSRIIVEPGAFLTVEPGAEIQLLGDNSVLEIQGKLELGQGVNFTFTYPNSNSGYVLFNAPASQSDNVICTGTAASISFTGANTGDKVLEVRQPDLLLPPQLTSFTLDMCVVALGTDARVAVLGTTTVDISRTTLTSNINGNNNHRGLHLFGQPNVNITTSVFENGKYGIYAPLFYGGAMLNLTSCTFRSCGTGLYTQGKGVNLDNVSFLSNGFGWRAELMSFPSNLIRVNAGTSTSDGNNTGIYYLSSANAALNITESTLNGNTNEGAWVFGAPLRMSCSEVKYNERNGLLMDQHSVLDICGDAGGSGGKVDLSKNAQNGAPDYAILLNNARDLFLSNGFNNLTPGRLPGQHCENLSIDCSQAIHGTISKGYSEGCNFDCSDLILPAYNNQWIFPVTLPRWSDEYEILTTYYCIDQNNIPLARRKVLLDPSPMAQLVTCDNPGGSPERTMLDCEECGMVESSTLGKIPFGQAVESIIGIKNDTNRNEPNRLAVSLFTEILNGMYPANVSQSQENLMSYARYQMFDALGKAIMNNEIPIDQNYPVVLPDVQQVITLLEGIISHTPCDPGYHERLAASMQIAQIYHLVNRRDLAMNQLNSILTWVSADERPYVEKWQCLMDIENKVLSGTIKLPEIEGAIMACNSNNLRSASFTTPDEMMPHKEEKVTISILPNPSNGYVSVRCSMDNLPAGKIVLYDLTGKAVFQAALNAESASQEININQLKDGIYFYRVYNNAKVVAYDKLVIMK